ncbi:MAG: helix-turn-helix domain-containing protein [Oscillospiraceae bacterium]|nr:helix-turn-helix domain-containing protein [Oscillospiraceae bacterium]
MSININIAGNLKRLRKSREITQEDLADFIGVSFQAVSKWERGEGYPDITILPVIANFFDVTLDELVGMNEIKNAKKLEEIKEQHYRLSSEGRLKDNIELLREALTIFPNDYWLLAELACFLDFYGDTDEEKKKNREEAIKISERILEFCTDPIIRSNVQANMCFSLYRTGNKEKAIELAEKLPNIFKTQEFVLEQFLDRDKQIEMCQKTIQKLAWGFCQEINILTKRWEHPLGEKEHYTAEQAIRLNQKAIDFFKLVYEDGDFDFSHIHLQDHYESIAQIYIKLGKIDESIVNLEKAAEHSISFVTLPETQKYTSLLLNALTFKRVENSTGTEKNNVYLLKDWIVNGPAYRSILNDERVQKILEELGKYAN